MSSTLEWIDPAAVPAIGTLAALALHVRCELPIVRWRAGRAQA